MEAVILAGGKGSRLKPYTLTLPKPLMPVGDEPILSIMIGQLRRAGVKKVTLAVNHMADIIMAFFGDGRKFGVKIAYSMEDKPLSTVGPLKLIRNLPEHFLVMNGDVLTDLNYSDLYKNHVKSGALFSIASYPRDQKIDFGVLEIDRARKTLTGFKEKPSYHFNVSMGVYVFNRKVLSRVPAGKPYGIDNLILDLLKDGQKIHAYPYSGYWLDIGRPDDYEKANEDIARVLKVKKPVRR
jgi:NDP-sugar pyrophosphorylase family protein